MKDNNVGIVIKTSNHYFREKDDVDYAEFMYYGDKVAGNGERQRRIVEGLRHYIETGDFVFCLCHIALILVGDGTVAHGARIFSRNKNAPQM